LSHAYAHNPATLLHIATYLRERGVQPVELFRRAGVPPAALLNGNGWVPRRLCFALGEQASAVVGERFFGARIGARFKLAEFGAWGRAILGAPNLRQACELAASGVALLHEGTDLRLVELGRHARLSFAYRGRLGANPLQHQIGTLAVLRKIALLAGAPEAVSVCFSMPYARGVDRLEESHGSALEFGCEHDAIVIDRDIMDHPLVGANGMGKSEESTDTAAAVGGLVKQLLPYGNITVDNIAERQRISVRTLQRRLREWGFSFEEIVDDVRRNEAIRHVLQGQNSTMEIAFLLGYSDQAHFSRAFKRWTGRSPRDYAKAYR
jgi:AraC-like DNA-binding protein